jgi:hypothetical protein
MPHPRFKHQWEEDSYWKHYEQYLESKADSEIKVKSNTMNSKAEAKAEEKAEGWQIVKRRSR